MKKILALLFTALCFCTQAQVVRIAAAANLRAVLTEINQKYSKENPDVKVLVNLGSSGALFHQITNGADFDLFMAADNVFPNKLKAQGLAKGDVKTYAFGKLVIWSNTVDVSKGIDIMADKSVNRIAVAKPELAPYGARAVECLKYYNVFDKYKQKIVFADNIAQAAQFAQTGNAELAFIALALAITPQMKGSYFVIDTKSYEPIEQAMVLINSRQNNVQASKFMDYIIGGECDSIFEKYGFIVPLNE